MFKLLAGHVVPVLHRGNVKLPLVPLFNSYSKTTVRQLSSQYENPKFDYRNKILNAAINEKWPNLRELLLNTPAEENAGFHNNAILLLILTNAPLDLIQSLVKLQSVKAELMRCNHTLVKTLYYTPPNKNIDFLLSLPEAKQHIADNENEVFFVALELEQMGVLIKLLHMEEVRQVFIDNKKLAQRAVAQLITLAWEDVLDLIPESPNNPASKPKLTLT